MFARLRHHAPTVTHHAPHLEHVGFFAYAACETFSVAHALIYVVSVYLFIAGGLVFLTVDVRRTKEDRS